MNNSFDHIQSDESSARDEYDFFNPFKQFYPEDVEWDENDPCVCGGIGCPECIDDLEYDHERDHFRDDVEADADALASAGWGTDEDYGGYDYDCDFDMYSEY